MNKEKAEALILGAGGYGKELKDLLDLEALPYRFKGFLDDAVLEKFKYGDSGQIKNELLYPIFLGIGSLAVRKNIIEKSHPNNFFPSLIHPMAFLEGPDIKLGKGTQILAFSTVSNETDIGDFTIVHRLCSLSHDT